MPTPPTNQPSTSELTEAQSRRLTALRWARLLFPTDNYRYNVDVARWIVQGKDQTP